MEEGSSAEDGRTEQIADTVFRDYAATLQGGAGEGADDAGFDDALARVRRHLADAAARSAACLVCLEPLAPDAAVWHCSGGAASPGGGCFCVVHLLCAQAWARSQQADASARAAALAAAPPDLSTPGAAAVAAAAAAARPPAPHSGPPGWGCPKCRAPYTAAEAPAEYHCFCGKVADPPFDPWAAPHSCGGACDRPLTLRCGHACMLLCHPGPCPPCPAEVTAECHCGRATLPPGRLPALHPQRADSLPVRRGDACGACPNAGPRTCPCGKVEYHNLACDEATPPCGATCDRLLACGRHRCTERCHAGACAATCREVVRKSCACGRMQRDVPCSEPLRCERRCQAMRACGRHQCKRRCCDGSACDACDQPCNRKLRCGNHVCPAQCHAGPCQPCPLTATVACACGATACAVPCGSEARTEPPRSVQACGHVCGNESCHDAPPPAVSMYAPPPPPVSELLASVRRLKPASDNGPPAAQAAAAAKAARPGACTACPPCQAPAVDCACHCGRSTITAPCDALVTARERGGVVLAELLCCWKPCARPLPACGHICGATCHAGCCPGADSCDQEVTVRCACRRLKGKMSCAAARVLADARGQSAPAKGAAAALLDCDDKCARRLEEKRGAKAAGAGEPKDDSAAKGTAFAAAAEGSARGGSSCNA
ncbi:hypothetical protein WJX81_004295 [Elliptochloris bilobata]|uniref:NF-X1-type domain-containing protein n=1 Tax=Elliptochloris bilobata TaxID=381761 RepID=A0AAW1S8A6_9CHLO